MYMDMNIYFLYEAAQCFASLDAASAEQVIGALLGSALLQSKAARSGTARPVPLNRVDVIHLEHTTPQDLWVGAFAERRDLTVVTLAHENPGEPLRARIRAIARAQKRPSIGGLSLRERPVDIQESIRELLEEHRRLLSSTGEMHESTRELNSVGQRLAGESRGTPLAQQLARSARRIGTAQARRGFKDVLEDASTTPQMVERDGEDVLIIGRELLERYEQPLSGAALAARFGANTLSRLKLAEESATEPDPQIRLGARSQR
jgi:hypothetical protein